MFSSARQLAAGEADSALEGKAVSELNQSSIMP
jgi:hypothetical protein